MLVIAAGFVALGLFGGLSEAARRGSGGARIAALAEGVSLIALAGFGLLIALVLRGLTCDDSCSYGTSPDWWHDANAWQWTGQLFVAVLGFAAVVSAVALAHSRSYRWAAALMTLAAASFGAWARFLAPLGNGLGI